MLVIPLNQLDILAVSGPDARRFLQGQVTCNMDDLTPEQSLRGAICNPKGRVVADFRALAVADACLLVMDAGMAGVAKGVLDKYMVFFKASSAIVTEQWRAFGLIGDEAATVLAEICGACPGQDGAVTMLGGLLLVRIPGSTARFEVWGAAETLKQTMERLVGVADAGSWEDWLLEDIKAGIAHVSPALSEQHLPEALNYDIAGVVSFKKGCYTGQEIVARMHYRGTAKRRARHLSLRASEPEPRLVGCTIDGETANGEIICRVQDRSGDWHLLVILPAGVEEARILVNEDPALVANLEALPYTL